MADLPEVEKKLKMFAHFDTIHERVGRTDGRTDRQTPHHGIGPYASRDKNGKKRRFSTNKSL